MDFDFTEEQKILRSMAHDFLANEFPKTLVREMEEDSIGFRSDIWKKMAELGWMGLVIPEEYGGSSGSFLDLLVLLEETGSACLVSPYLSTVICTLLILHAGSDKQKKEYLPKIASGDMLFSLALSEPSASYDANGIAVKAIADKNEYIINGVKLFVHDAQTADYFICITRTDQMAADEKSISVFIVDAKSKGITITSMPSIADDKQTEVTFENVSVSKTNMLGDLNAGWPVVSKVLEHAAVAKCAEMIGGADWIVENCVDYVKVREQFGKPIGTFGILQHYLAEMWAEIGMSKRLVYYAGWLIDQGLPCTLESAMAKARMSKIYKKASRMGVQIHGGIGTTREHDMGLYFRRARAAFPLFVDPEYCCEKIACEIGL